MKFANHSIYFPIFLIFVASLLSIYSGVRTRYYWFRLVAFPSSIALSVSSVFADRSGVVKLFVAGIVFFIHCVLTASLLPYVKWRTNFFYMCIGIASLVTKTNKLKNKSTHNSSSDRIVTWIQYVCLYISDIFFIFHLFR
jgi:hypothetical protein